MKRGAGKWPFRSTFLWMREIPGCGTQNFARLLPSVLMGCSWGDHCPPIHGRTRNARTGGLGIDSWLSAGAKLPCRSYAMMTMCATSTGDTLGDSGKLEAVGVTPFFSIWLPYLIKTQINSNDFRALTDSYCLLHKSFVARLSCWQANPAHSYRAGSPTGRWNCDLQLPSAAVGASNCQVQAQVPDKRGAGPLT